MRRLIHYVLIKLKVFKRTNSDTFYINAVNPLSYVFLILDYLALLLVRIVEINLLTNLL